MNESEVEWRWRHIYAYLTDEEIDAIQDCIEGAYCAVMSGWLRNPKPLAQSADLLRISMQIGAREVRDSIVAP